MVLRIVEESIVEGRERRFEFIQGNQAKFWSVSRRGATLTVASGRIGGQTKTRTKQLADYMAAEQEFDRLIRDKLRRGYVEVQKPSEPEGPMPDRWLSLVPVDGSAPLELKPAATRYMVWRMVEVGIMDRQTPPPDLSRWAERASRRLRLTEIPESSHPQHGDFRQLFLELSAGDRASELGQHGVVGAYKLAQGSDWIVTGKEAAWLADGARTRTPRRHKIAANAQQWLDDWITFHERVSDTGYTVQVRNVAASRPAPRPKPAQSFSAPAPQARDDEEVEDEDLDAEMEDEEDEDEEGFEEVDEDEEDGDDDAEGFEDDDADVPFGR
jgi:predicted DNA-binding WGR domain protein